MRTIQKAAEVARAGDTVLVRAGVYKGLVLLRFSGEPDKPVIFKNAPSEKPVVDGDGRGRIELQSEQGWQKPIGWITVEGFEVRNGWDGIKFYNAHHIVLKGNFIHDNANQGILGNGHHVRIEGNIIAHNGFKPDNEKSNKEHGIYATGTDFEIINNVIHSNRAYGIQVAAYPYKPENHAGPEFAAARRWLISHNTIGFQQNRAGIVVWQEGATDCVIENNIFYRNAVTLGRGDCQGIDFLSAGGGHIIRSNLFYGPERTSIANKPGDCVASNNLENKDPQFVDAERLDFRLQPDSPATSSGAYGPLYKDASVTTNIEFFVSLHGNDTWSGRLRDPGANDGPFATLKRARDAVRGGRQTQQTQLPARVTIRGGTYYLDRPIEFGPQDSGTERAPVVYAAAKGEKVVLSGGRPLSSGRWGEANGQRAWVVDVPEAKQGWRFRQLFVNGERRPRTRLPKQGEYQIEALPDVPITNEAWEKPVRRFVYAGTDIQRWHNLGDVEVIAACRWVDNRLPIQEVDTDKRMVTFDRSSVFNLVELYHTKPCTYWVENVFEALDTPGLWYLDRSLGRLFYLPAKGEDLTTAELIAPRLAQVVRVVGETNTPVQFLRFEGLTFAHTEWQPPANWAASSQAATDVPAALFFANANRCIISQCQVEHVGTYAIEVSAGCQNIEISHNRLTDLGGGGIKVGHDSHRTTVADNEIAHAGRMFLSAVGIWVGHSDGNQIVHNHIQDLHYSGISVGWQWNFKPSRAMSNVVEFNHIHDLGHGLLSDMGGIYTLGVSPGTRLRGNLIHDVKARAYGGWGIYPDEGSSEIIIESNLVYRCSSSPFFAHYNRNITVQNNIFALGEQCQVERAGAMSGSEQEYTFQRNIVYYRQGQLVGYWDPQNRTFGYERNLYWNASGAPITCSGKSFAEWQAAGHDKDTVVADPLFLDPERGDFRLRPESPAIRIGFQPWDLSGAGPRPLPAAPNTKVVFPGEAWQHVPPESQGIDGTKMNAALEYLDRALKDYGGAGTLFIIRKGYAIWSGPDCDQEYQIYSATKSFTSTVLGLLIQDGTVSLNTLAKEFEPVLAEHYSSVTLRHFATMTSGYDSVGGNYEFDTQGRGDSWNPGPPAPPIFPPGSKFRYWDDAMMQFGNVLTKAARTPLDQFFKTRIADPIGMTQWHWTENDTPAGRVLCWTGGIWTSSRELARFGHLFLNHGNWNGRQLIDASWVDQATSVQVPATVPNDTLPRSRGAGVYGFNWWVNGVKPNGQRLWPGAPPRTYYANGLHNNVCIIVPEWKMVITRTNGGKKDGSTNTPANVDEIWSGFFSRLGEAVAR